MSELGSLAQSDAHRYRGGEDWFVVSRQMGLVCTRVGATAERVVDVWHALATHLDPAVDVRIDDVRTARAWEGTLLALPEVREAMGRLRLPLAAYGGVEMSVFTDQDQLTLTPEMLLVVYSRTDRWPFLLDGMGLAERTHMPPPAWLPSRDTLRPEAQLEQVLQAAAERLQLREVTT
jgi:hypothetical protein